MKSIIINSLVFFISISANCQERIADSTAFRNDFEKLLKKYGFETKSYIVNVQSVGQKGGQTAFVINNNFYGDTLSEEFNISYEIITEGSQKILYAAPKKGVWITPFVCMDSLKWRSNVYNPGIGVVVGLSNLTAKVEKKLYHIGGVGSNNSCSSVFTMVMYLSQTDPNEFLMFGDLQDPLKTYLYYKGKVIWFVGDVKY